MLVTGGAGFIGSHIVDCLIKEDYQVVIVDNLSSGFIDNFKKNIIFYPLDINDAALDNIFFIEKPEIVIHQAAQVSVKESMDDPMNDCKQNINGTIHLLECCKKHKVKKIIYASSAAVYGLPEYVPIPETHVLSPESFYGISKVTSEAYIRLYSKLCGLKYTILRYSNVYGPRQSIDGEAGVIRIFLDRFKQNRPVTIYGDGNQKRDFVYVKDVAEANLLGIKHADNEVINISSNTSKSINEIVILLSILLGKKKEKIYISERPGDIRDSCLSNQKAQHLLHWEPNFSLIKGLEETINSL
ncbi:MAG TPA: NAD-dependent epimerase/dehydratase family protein [Pseudoneobacillus sp.]|nr:NAD-dependent epimerase/dehydratase family protein [Pseudoneobacillus sp.]